ncbi:hypothetical protein ACH5AG_10280 [Streptomyces anulatus]
MKWSASVRPRSFNGRSLTPHCRPVGCRAHRFPGRRARDLFAAVRPLLADEITATARRARARIERALGRDGQPTVLDRPCPHCPGQLTAHTRSGDPAAATVACSTGSACTAPVLLSARGRREWAGAELVGLFVALSSAG